MAKNEKKKSFVEKAKSAVGIGDEPVEETPVEETPVEETPVEETPVEETPVEETPVTDSKDLVKMVKKKNLDGSEEEEPYQTGNYHPDNVDDMVKHGWEKV